MSVGCPGATSSSRVRLALTRIVRPSNAPPRLPPITAKPAPRGSWRSPAHPSGTSASRVARKPAPCRSGTSRCAKSARHVATWPGSLATPLPHPRTGQGAARRRDAVAGHGPPARRPGDLLSRAFARASGRACRPGQGPQPPDRREILLRLQRFGEGHELPKGQEGHPRGHEATERRHPTVDGGHQPVQQEAQAQSAPADAPQEESKDGDAAQQSWPRPFPGSGASVGASGGPSAGDYGLDNPVCVSSMPSCLRDLGRRESAGSVAWSPTPPATELADGTILTP